MSFVLMERASQTNSAHVEADSTCMVPYSAVRSTDFPLSVVKGEFTQNKLAPLLFFLNDCINLVSFARQALKVSLSLAVYTRQVHEEQEEGQRNVMLHPSSRPSLVLDQAVGARRFPAPASLPLSLSCPPIPPALWALVQYYAISTSKYSFIIVAVMNRSARHFWWIVR